MSAQASFHSFTCTRICYLCFPPDIFPKRSITLCWSSAYSTQCFSCCDIVDIQLFLHFSALKKPRYPFKKEKNIGLVTMADGCIHHIGVNSTKRNNPKTPISWTLLQIIQFQWFAKSVRRLKVTKSMKNMNAFFSRVADDGGWLYIF